MIYFILISIAFVSLILVYTYFEFKNCCNCTKCNGKTEPESEIVGHEIWDYEICTICGYKKFVNAETYKFKSFKNITNQD